MTNQEQAAYRFRGQVALEPARRRGYGSGNARVRWFCNDVVSNSIHAHGGVDVDETELAVYGGRTRDQAFAAVYDRLQLHFTEFHADVNDIGMTLPDVPIEHVNEPLWRVRGFSGHPYYMIGWTTLQPNMMQLIGPFKCESDARAFGRKHFPRRYKTLGRITPDNYIKRMKHDDD